MTKPCPYCGKQIGPSRITCRRTECQNAEAYRWHQERLEADRRRIAERRAARVPRAVISPERRFMVLMRYGWTCHICGDRIDHSLKWPHPGSATVDHIKPLSKGGTNSWRNLAAAHAECNNTKQANEKTTS